MADHNVLRIIAAACGRREEIVSAISEVGVERAADILVDEIAHRFQWPPLEFEDVVTARFSLAHGDERLSRVLAIGSSGIERDPDQVSEPHVEVFQDLAEMVVAVFGRKGVTGTSTRRVALCGSTSVESYRKPPAHHWVTQRLLATMDTRYQVALTELAARHGSDKWGIHFYTQHYQRYWEPIRDRQLTLLEIGVGGFGDPDSGGASLRMWKSYFPRSQVYGIDIADKRGVAEQRIDVGRTDQTDRAALASLVRRTGPLDIVIDDGSHVSEHVLTSFSVLFPHVRDGGWYVIEDLQTSYWPKFGGRSDDLTDPLTSIGFLKSLVDSLNHEEVLSPGSRVNADLGRMITGVHFHHNIVFIEKGMNAEGGGPEWLRNESKVAITVPALDEQLDLPVKSLC